MKERNYFIWLVAVAIVCGLGYFGYETYTPAIKDKYVSGEKVYASIDDDHYFTESQLYEAYTDYDQENLVRLWIDAVINNAIKDEDLTKEEWETIKSTTKSHRAQAKQNYPDTAEYAMAIDLSEMGVTDPEEYSKLVVKLQRLTLEYLKEHEEEYKEQIETTIQPRKLRIIAVENSYDEELIAKIDAAIEEKGFEEAAKEFSEVGQDAIPYIDQTNLSQLGLPDDVNSYLMSAQDGDILGWYTLDDNNSSLGFTGSYKFKVYDTGYEKNKDNEKMYYNYATYAETQYEVVLDTYEKSGVEIEYLDESIKESLEEGIQGIRDIVDQKNVEVIDGGATIDYDDIEIGEDDMIPEEVEE